MYYLQKWRRLVVPTKNGNAVPGLSPGAAAGKSTVLNGERNQILEALGRLEAYSVGHTSAITKVEIQVSYLRADIREIESRVTRLEQNPSFRPPLPPRAAGA